MADHIERVVVQGEVELNTGNATKQLDNLKKPIKVELDLQSSEAIAKTQKEINALLRKINSMDFDGLKQSLTKSIANGSKDGIKEAERQAKLLNDAFNKTLWKSKTKDGKEISHSFTSVLRDMRQEMLSINKTLKSFNEIAGDRITLKINAGDLDNISSKLLDAQKSLSKYQDVVKQIDSLSLSSGISTQLSDIDKLVNSLNANFGKLEKTIHNINNLNVDKNTNKQRKPAEKQNSIQNDEAEKQAKRIKQLKESYEKIHELNRKMSGYDLSGDKFKGANAYQRVLSDIEKVKSALKELNEEMSKDSADIDLSKIEKSMNDIEPSVKKVDKAFEQLNQTISQFEANKNANNSLNWLDRNTKAIKKYGDEIRRIAELQRTELSKGVQESLAKQMASIQSSAKREGLVGKNWTDSFKKSLGSLSQIFGSFSLLNRADDIAHEMIGTIHEVDDALTDLQMATSVSDKEAQSLMETYSQMGKELKATGVDVAKSSTEWLKQGKSLKEAETLTTDSIILSKVGDLSSEESTKYLTSAMKGFKVEAKDALDIVDKLSAVDMVSATDVGGLAEGMSKVAASADLAGISMDKLLSYLAVVGETTQEGMSSVGNSFNAIFARMGNIKLGRLKDYQNSGEDLSDVETVLKGQNIDLRDENKQFRNFGEVLDEVAGNWENYSSVSQRAIAKAFAGKQVVNARKYSNVLVLP
ncbi:phage tail tape measure protein [Blautia hansenii]|uniref:phage tail tape measure protein n=1 Tax=Blautia hansenii TaxID=1322 RepID=UPI0022DFD44D|nr:phage tail tape measure protein [Blautia hansenii]